MKINKSFIHKSQAGQYVNEPFSESGRENNHVVFHLHDAHRTKTVRSNLTQRLFDLSTEGGVVKSNPLVKVLLIDK